MEPGLSISILVVYPDSSCAQGMRTGLSGTPIPFQVSHEEDIGNSARAGTLTEHDLVLVGGPQYEATLAVIRDVDQLVPVIAFLPDRLEGALPWRQGIDTYVRDPVLNIHRWPSIVVDGILRRPSPRLSLQVEDGEWEDVLGRVMQVRMRRRRLADLSSHMFELSRVIEERDLTRRKLEGFFRAFPDLCIHADHRGRIMDVHGGSATHMEINAESLVGRPVVESFAESARQAIEQIVLRATSGVDSVAEYETTIDGRFVAHEVRAVSIGSRESLLFVRDVTERQLAHDALIRNQRRMKLVVEAGRVGLWEWTPSTEEFEGNDVFYDMLGVTRGVSRQEMLDRIDHEDRLTFESSVKIALDAQTPFECELHIRHPLGIRNIVCRGVLHDVEEGMPMLMGACLDVTEQRRSAEDYRTIFDAPADAILVVDRASKRVTDCNRAAANLFGWSKEEFDHRGDLCLLGDGSETFDPAHMFDILEIHQGLPHLPVVLEWRCQTARGNPFWAEVSLGVVELSGEPRIVARIRNIDHRKRNQAMVESAIRRFRAITENLDTPFLEVSETGLITGCNPSLERMLGDVITTATMDSLIGPEAATIVRGVIASGGSADVEGTVAGLRYQWKVVGVPDGAILVARGRPLNG